MAAVDQLSPSRISHPAPGAALVEAAPLAALGLRQMPTETHFLRDHFGVPDLDQETWTLGLGAPGRELRLTLDDLKGLPTTSLTVVLECAGHRRSEYEPPARGVGWGVGAVSEAVWTGARLRDVLGLLGTGDTGDTDGHVLLEGADAGPVGDYDFSPFARAIPIEKALDDDTLLAWEMNGEPLGSEHGAPLRAIVPGWYATDSVKWLVRIEKLSVPFEGHFEISDYRLSTPDGVNRMTTLPVSSLLTSHPDGALLPRGLHSLEGIAWGGRDGIGQVEISIAGSPWQPARLERSSARHGRSFWTFAWEAKPGEHVIRVRATDGTGRSQPDSPMWNERGFANASAQRLRIRVAR